MKLEDTIMNENVTIKEVAKRLETSRCRIIYIVRDKKLVASVSDGDIRRFVIKGEDINSNVSVIANYTPKYAYEYDDIIDLFANNELYSIPILNLNKEIVGVHFKDGRKLSVETKHINYPLVIMAGGKGTRLYPYTKILPKALIPIGELPITERIIYKFVHYDVKDVYLVLNHMKNMIEAYFDGTSKTYNLNYVEEKESLGTGGGLSLLKGKIHSDFFLTNCDIIVDADYEKICEYHEKNNCFITIVAAVYNHKIPYGVLNISKNKDSYEYESVTEKPEFEYMINTGVYLVNSSVIDELPENTNIGFPEIIENYKQQGKRIGVYIVEEDAYMDMGQIEELDKMKKKLNIN